MKLPFAPNFERFLEERGYLEVEELETKVVPFEYLGNVSQRRRTDYAVKLDGKQIGVYKLITDNCVIFRQIYTGKMINYPDSQLRLIKVGESPDKKREIRRLVTEHKLLPEKEIGLEFSTLPNYLLSTDNPFPEDSPEEQEIDDKLALYWHALRANTFTSPHEAVIVPNISDKHATRKDGHISIPFP